MDTETKANQTLYSMIISTLKKAGHKPYNKKRGTSGYVVWCDKYTHKVFVGFERSTDDVEKAQETQRLYTALHIAAKAGSPFISDWDRDCLITVVPYNKERANIKYLPKFI